MRVGIVGCGLIGQKRARVVSEQKGDELVVVADIDEERAEALAREHACSAVFDWESVVWHPGVDAVVIATVNKMLAPIAIAAAQAGKHVLCEKPLGRNAAEARAMVEAARESGVCLKTGFNHRYHPAIMKAHEVTRGGAIGEPHFIRCVYGHGGRPGYDEEWRADLDLAGGGELLDQGVHVVDLCRWFLGDFSDVFGFTPGFYWGAGRGSIAPVGSEVEDNAFALLRTTSGRCAQIHTSWTQWKNRFSFEVFGREGYVSVEGLGGSYGTESLVIGRRRMEGREFKGGAPDVEALHFTGPDESWHAEWTDFTDAISEEREPLANGDDGLEAMRLIQAIYASSASGKVVAV